MSVPAKRDLAEANLTREIIGAFFEVYNTLGTGFVEAVYAAALAHEMRLRGLSVDREVPVEIVYKSAVVITQRLDLVVNDKVVVECKATPFLLPAAQRQINNYLRATQFEVGLLLHFGQVPRFMRFYVANIQAGNATSGASGISDASENRNRHLKPDY